MPAGLRRGERHAIEKSRIRGRAEAAGAELDYQQAPFRFRLARQIDKGHELAKKQILAWDDLQTARTDFTKWDDFNRQLLLACCSTEGLATEYRISYSRVFPSDMSPLSQQISDLKRRTLNKISKLESIRDRLPFFREVTSANENNEGGHSFEKVHLVLDRFHRVALQLRKRRQGRTSLLIEDEYDAQDLLRSLLALFFDDIRLEEWTPSHAGKSARVDFLLKPEGVVIEVKVPREGQSERQVGDELIVDIDRYRKNSDCERLICFVYDPTDESRTQSGSPVILPERRKVSVLRLS